MWTSSQATGSGVRELDTEGCCRAVAAASLLLAALLALKARRRRWLGRTNWAFEAANFLAVCQPQRRGGDLPQGGALLKLPT